MGKNNEQDFSTHSALFSGVTNSIFLRDKIANQIKEIYVDKNHLNNKINNEDRVKDQLFNLIQNAYNHRISEYDLNLNPLSRHDKKSLQILEFSISSEDEEKVSGYYAVYPRTFYCNKCGDFRIFANDKEWEKFDPMHCRTGCGGKYEQISVLEYCETCGKIDSVYHYCKNKEHGKDYLRLNTNGSKDNLNVWRIECTAEGCDWSSNFISLPCNHKNKYTKEPISDAKPTPFKPLNVQYGGIYKSCVKTIVDVPDEINSDFVNEIYLGFYFHDWDSFDLYEEDKVDDLQFYLDIYDDLIENERKAIRRNKPENIEMAKKVHSKLEEIKERLEGHNIYEIMDYLILTDGFDDSKKSKNTSLHDMPNISSEDFKEFGIENITYIPEMQLISSSYGTISGINRFYESNFVPHFEPHWIKNDEDEYVIGVYSYPFETEGIMFDLDKVKLVNWLVDNSEKYNEYVSSDEEAKKFLLEVLDKDSKDYERLETLIHTFAHILIKRSSLYTGLNSDSCGELLFPLSGAFLIYSTSNINIGGFSYVFENSLLKWFNDVKLDIDDCIFDPSCIDDTGACFSCIYLPEYVCSEFNYKLDRDVFIGQHRYKKGFW